MKRVYDMRKEYMTHGVYSLTLTGCCVAACPHRFIIGLLVEQAAAGVVARHRRGVAGWATGCKHWSRWHDWASRVASRGLHEWWQGLIGRVHKWHHALIRTILLGASAIIVSQYIRGMVSKNETTTKSGLLTEGTTKSGLLTEITTKSGLLTEITTKSGLLTESTTKSGILTEITTKSGLLTESTTKSEILTEITTKSGLLTEITTKSGLLTEITTKSELLTEITTKSGLLTEITTMSGILTEITQSLDF